MKEIAVYPDGNGDGCIVELEDEFIFRIGNDLLEEYDLTVDSIRKTIESDMKCAIDTLIACVDGDESCMYFVTGPPRLETEEVDQYINKQTPPFPGKVVRDEGNYVIEHLGEKVPIRMPNGYRPVAGTFYKWQICGNRYVPHVEPVEMLIGTKLIDGVYVGKFLPVNFDNEEIEKCIE